MKLFILLGLVLPALGREINPFVVGGTNAAISAYPHQLSLRVSNSHSCGASLISTTRAVTAAHCVTSALSSYSILGGSTERTSTTGPTSVLFKPTSIASHPSFSNVGFKGFPNDVAVLKFNAVTFNANFKPIALAQPSDGDLAKQQGTITGWGRTQGGGAIPVTLQQATLTVLSNADCAKKWSTNQINAGHICISAPSSGACQGDSGGPLVVNGKLAGATSWGSSNCQPTSPSVYTRISHFLSWINAQ
jgi:trypsin